MNIKHQLEHNRWERRRDQELPGIIVPRIQSTILSCIEDRYHDYTSCSEDVLKDASIIIPCTYVSNDYDWVNKRFSSTSYSYKDSQYRISIIDAIQRHYWSDTGCIQFLISCGIFNASTQNYRFNKSTPIIINGVQVPNATIKDFVICDIPMTRDPVESLITGLGTTSPGGYALSTLVDTMLNLNDPEITWSSEDELSYAWYDTSKVDVMMYTHMSIFDIIDTYWTLQESLAWMLAYGHAQSIRLTVKDHHDCPSCLEITADTINRGLPSTVTSTNDLIDLTMIMV
jgi:hypothetical protein